MAIQLKEKYICLNCNKRYGKKIGKCIACGSFDIEELSETPMESNGIAGSMNGLYNHKIKTMKASEVLKDSDKGFKVVRRFDKFPSFDHILSSEGGLLESQVIIIGASPGTGKTTMCTQLSDENTLFISSEETRKQVSHRFERCNACMDTQILESVNEEEILSAIAQTDCNLIILDSLNSIEDDNGGIASYAKTANIAQKITHLVKSQHKSIIIISQVTKNDNIVGMESIKHAVDTVLHMERSSTSDRIILTSSKNRFAEVGEIMFLQHGDCGLQEVENECGSMNTIGSTIFKMVSGSKKIPMEIQALIVSTDDKPVRRSIGISFNKLCLIDAILKSNDHDYNTRYSDIYMSTSNGLYLPEGNDLVIANSLLSAYYQKVLDLDDSNLDAFHGFLSLNGGIIGSNRFKHIRDLIRLYHYNM